MVGTIAGTALWDGTNPIREKPAAGANDPLGGRADKDVFKDLPTIRPHYQYVRHKLIGSLDNAFERIAGNDAIIASYVIYVAQRPGLFCQQGSRHFPLRVNDALRSIVIYDMNDG